MVPNQKKELKKMNSIDSRFTFKNQITEKEKVEKKENIENENCNGTTVDINDYITSIPKDVLFPNIKHRRKYESYKNLNEINSLCNKVKDFQLHDEDLKPIYESSEKIVINEDSKMYADLLEIIYELYKNKEKFYKGIENTSTNSIEKENDEKWFEEIQNIKSKKKEQEKEKENQAENKRKKKKDIKNNK